MPCLRTHKSACGSIPEINGEKAFEKGVRKKKKAHGIQPGGRLAAARNVIQFEFVRREEHV